MANKSVPGLRPGRPDPTLSPAGGEGTAGEGKGGQERGREGKRRREGFYTLNTIPDEFWYIWCILVTVTFGTPVGTLHQ